MRLRILLTALAAAASFSMQEACAQTDRVEATVRLSTINDILEKLRISKGLDQSGYQNLGHALPINYTAEVKKVWLDLNPAENKSTLNVNLNISSDFDFALFNYDYSQDFHFKVHGELSINRKEGESAGSIQLCPSRTSHSVPLIWCLASGSPVSCAISSEITSAVHNIVDNMKCLDISALGKVLPSVDLAVVKSNEPIRIYSDRIGFGYTLKQYRIPVNLAPVLSLLLD